MFVHMVNEQPRNELEWDRAYEEGRRLVREARVRRAEFREELRKQRLLFVAQAVGRMMYARSIYGGGWWCEYVDSDGNTEYF